MQERTAFGAFDLLDASKRRADVVELFDFGTECLAGGNPCGVGVARHDDLGVRTHRACGIRNRHCVVAGADRSDPTGQGFVVERLHREHDAARLERTGVLEQFQLEPQRRVVGNQCANAMTGPLPCRRFAHQRAQLAAC